MAGRNQRGPPGERPRGASASQSPRGRRQETAAPRPTVRRAHERGLKVSGAAARGIRSGHPWIFRDSIRRDVAGLEAGTSVRVFDEEGYPLGWGLYEPEGAIALRMVSKAEHLRWDEDELARRIDAAKLLRETRLEPGVHSACRLIHGDGEGLPGLAVDRLGEFLLVYKYSLAAEAYLERLLPVLQAAFEPAGIYMQDRVRPVRPDDRRPPAFHMAGKPAPPEIEVVEDGLRFIVDVTAPVSPGLFLDLREGRRLCETLAANKRVLNLFSFTGSFGLRAIRGGATEVVNVDAAARSHSRCRQNLQASGMDPEACRALNGDAFKYLERMRRRGESFDLVVVDPPPYSRVKGAKPFSAHRDWQELMAAVAAVVAPDGEVLAISNASKLSEDELMFAIGEGADRGDRFARLVGECALPVDFPVPAAFTEGRYLKIKRLVLSPR